MASEVVRLARREDGVAVLTLDRPPMNAIDESVVRGLVEATGELAADDSVRAVLVRSAVEGVFMAGADLTTIAGLDASQVETILQVQEAFTAFADLPQPIVAAINGHALGGGCELALACDFRFMARNHGLIGQPEVRLGLIPGAGGTQRLTRLLGPGRAASYLMKGLQVGADDAERDGLVHFAVDEDTLETRALDFAVGLARQAPIALRAIKRALRAAGAPDGYAVERDGFRETLLSEDAKTGVAAFFAGDKPRFRGR
jgi:enoyl-CoA hydratase/carnithine racemase